MDQLLQPGDRKGQCHCVLQWSSRYRQGAKKRDWHGDVTHEVVGVKASASLGTQDQISTSKDDMVLSPTFREAVCVVDKWTRHIVEAELVRVLEGNVSARREGGAANVRL